MAWHQFSPCICNTFQCFLSTKFTGKQKKKIQQEEMCRKRQKRGCFFWHSASNGNPMLYQCMGWGPRRGRGVGWCGIQSARTMEPNWGPGDEGGIIVGVLQHFTPPRSFLWTERDEKWAWWRTDARSLLQGDFAGRIVQEEKPVKKQLYL